MPPPPILIQNASKRYRRSPLPWRRATINAVDNVSLSIEPGTIHGLVGPNGAGKTTLMRLALGLVQPNDGTVRLLGEPHSAMGTPALRRVGALIEEPRFLPHLSGRDNLLQIATLLGRRAGRTIDAAMADVGLTDRADDKVRGYSLGMRQRLGLARCLIGDPEVLILDEPTNGMDPQGIEDTRRVLRRFVDERGAAVLLSSHLLHGVEQLCDVVSFMDAGRVVRTGTLDELGAGANEFVLSVDDVDTARVALEGVLEDGTWSLEAQNGGTYLLRIAGDCDAGATVRAIVESGATLTEFVARRASLQSIYERVMGPEHHLGWRE